MNYHHVAIQPQTLIGKMIWIVDKIMGCLFVWLVLLYRMTLGQWLRGYCRFRPTCSQYMIDAIHRYGPWRGIWRGIKRLIRCHPWGGSGYDPA